MDEFKVEQFGVHLMIDGYGANANLLNEIEHFKGVLTNLPDTLGMHKICEPIVVRVGENNKKDPGGLSGFVMIAESHISFHSFPNRGFISVDVYTCNTDTDLEAVQSHIIEAFGITDSDTKIVARGERYPEHDLTEKS